MMSSSFQPKLSYGKFVYEVDTNSAPEIICYVSQQSNDGFYCLLNVKKLLVLSFLAFP